MKQDITLNVYGRRVGKTTEIINMFKNLKNTLTYRFACLIIVNNSSKAREFYGLLKDDEANCLHIRTADDLTFTGTEQSIFDYVLIDDYFGYTIDQRGFIDKIVDGFKDTKAIAWGTPSTVVFEGELEVYRSVAAGNSTPADKVLYESIKETKPNVHGFLSGSWLVRPGVKIFRKFVDIKSVEMFYDKKTLDNMRAHTELFNSEIIGKISENDKTIYTTN